MVLDPRMARASRGGGAAPDRRGGVPAGIAGDQFDVEQPLLGQPDDGGRPGNAGKTPVTTAPPSSMTAHGGRPARSASDREAGADAEHLLVVTEREVHVAGRGDAGRDQRLDGLEDRHQRALVVDGAAAVHAAVSTSPQNGSRDQSCPVTGTTS